MKVLGSDIGGNYGSMTIIVLMILCLFEDNFFGL